MKNLWIKIIALVSLLCSGAPAAFIQSPITPNSKQNFLLDRDGDGRMDQIALSFLGVLDENYVATMLDSLAFDWLDTAGVRTHYVVDSKQMKLDSLNPRQVNVDLRHLQKQFMPMTGLRNMEFAGHLFDEMNLYVADSLQFLLKVKDSMAPAISKAHLRSYRGKSADTLTVSFTESVEANASCNTLLEFKTAKDSVVRVLPISSVQWGLWRVQAAFEIPGGLNADERLATRDSIRLISKCVKDSSGNAISENAPFFPVTGMYPFEVTFPVMAVDRKQDVSDAPIFKLVFEDAAEPAEDSLWQVSMEVMGPEFENALREALNIEDKKPIDMKKLKITSSVKIYTNLGSYVVGTKMDVRGDDPRFVYSPTRFALRWNLMDGRRRRVASGAYLAAILLVVEYDGKIVYRNDEVPGLSSRVFGVIRR